MDVREMASLGGYARAKSMSPEERSDSAKKASAAAAKARRKKARERRAKQPKPA